MIGDLPKIQMYVVVIFSWGNFMAIRAQKVSPNCTNCTKCMVLIQGPVPPKRTIIISSNFVVSSWMILGTEKCRNNGGSSI